MGRWSHACIEGRLAVLLAGFKEVEAAIEVTVRIRPGKWLVPDVVVQERSRIQDPYPLEPVFLCAEILSPEDRIGEIFAKCEDYLRMGCSGDLDRRSGIAAGLGVPADRAAE